MVESLSKPSGVNPVFTEAAKEHANVVKILTTSEHAYVEMLWLYCSQRCKSLKKVTRDEEEEEDIFVSGQFYIMVSITGLSCGLVRQRSVVGALLQNTF